MGCEASGLSEEVSEANVAARRSTKAIPTTIGGEPWTIVFHNLPDGEGGKWGLCNWEDRDITLDPRVFNPAVVSEYREHVTAREVALHEALHGQCPWLAEHVLDRMAKELDDYLEALDL